MENKKGWKDVPIAGLIVEPGNSVEYKTGSWRSYRPVWHPENCIHCLFCFYYCPDSAIMVKDGKMTGINYDFCKGCGICVTECPTKPEKRALELKLESEFIE
ncbi:4Fe-4S binding protein [bacterium]|nr:4Fe-4S binding protein [bacterium]